MSFQAKRRVDYWLGGLLLLLLFPLVKALAVLLRRDHTLDQRRGCVVIKMVGAGSLFLAMPSLLAIKARFPAGHFYLVGTPAVTAFAEPYGWFDAQWTIDDTSAFRLLVSTLRVAWRMRRSADHLIDLEVHSRLTTALGLVSMVRNRIGFVDEIVFWRQGFYTHMTWFSPHGPVYLFYDLLAKWFGVDRIDVTGFNASFRHHIGRVALPDTLALPSRYLAIGHGCSGFGQERKVTPAEWARILRPLSIGGFEFVFLGAPADASLADAIIAAVGHGRNLCGALTLPQSAQAIARSLGFHGIDSLLLHLARALDVATVSLWGPTDPATRLRPLPATRTHATSPTGVHAMPSSERVAYARLPCSPCIHVNETPPCQGRRLCMAAAVDLLLAPPDAVRPEPACGWDVDPSASDVRAVSIEYA